jgi:hypothetical protein
MTFTALSTRRQAGFDLIRPYLWFLVLPAFLFQAAATRGAVTPRIVNGLETFNFPTTGALLYGAGGVPINADNAMLYCSGTLIGCHTFLTAAHCVSGDADASHYAVYLQNAGVVSISSVTGLGGNDVAVVTLGRDVTGIDPTPVNSTYDLAAIGVGLPGTIVGFGLSYYNANAGPIPPQVAVESAAIWL